MGLLLKQYDIKQLILHMLMVTNKIINIKKKKKKKKKYIYIYIYIYITINMVF